MGLTFLAPCSAVLLFVGLSGCAAERCVDFCERSHEDLVSIFDLPDDVCEDAAIVAAGYDCDACEAAFSERHGIEAEVCVR